MNDLMIVIVDITGGPQSEPDPFHAHAAEQVCYVAEGEVIVTIGEKQEKLKAGDVYTVPGNVPHTVQLLTPTLRLIDTFHPIREDFLP
jgi:quercetin dioxygenase-like cupin family protein